MAQLQAEAGPAKVKRETIRTRRGKSLRMVMGRWQARAGSQRHVGVGGGISSSRGAEGESGNKALRPTCTPRLSHQPRACLDPDVVGQVLTCDCGTGRNQFGWRAFEDDFASVVPGAGAEVDDPVGVGHHRLMMLNDDHRLSFLD